MGWFASSLFALWSVLLVNVAWTVQGHVTQNDIKDPTVFVVLLARNKEHTLPYFLTLFERLNYPKERMSLFIRSDHNQDRTIDILQDWLEDNRNKYHSVEEHLDQLGPKKYPDDKFVSDWSDERFDNIISMKEEALKKARGMWADFIWFLDMDIFLTEPDALHILLNEDKAIIGPMLNSLATYSNYWGGMTEDYWYTRTDDYLPILERKERGCFAVPMVHSFVLVDLTRRASDNLTFVPKNVQGYNGPNDDIITFAISAKNAGIDMYVCNSIIYGFIPPPLDNNQGMDIDLRQLLSIKLEVLVFYPPLPVTPNLAKYVPPMPKKDKLGLDQIYLISLARRHERRERMLQCFDELGLDVKIFDAVDGQLLNDSYLKQLGVKQLAGYKDPWAQRDMTFGEIGCFLSHYFIWEDIVNNGYKKVLLFEDDIRFEPFFKEKVRHMVRQSTELVDWDLIYLGRKKLKSADEPWVDDSDYLVHVGYSYWTLCYVITLEGAKKLLDGEPLGKMLPVDEYLPIMFDRHPDEEWKESFDNRNLNAYSVSPLFVYPTHYTGEPGYISDTEDSVTIISDESQTTVEPELEDKGLGLEVGLNGLGKEEL
ncbi:glycosyltransferase 25 family member-like [Penaeus monodon]|uniref:glycosyltransferase 25 family member-like n=1 Tax=Penaeus monodon TaxID=6687 RepID=UPI0018A73798|nr:glycosyltransferase 25 family member-like [Penaeus monodon]